MDAQMSFGPDRLKEHRLAPEVRMRGHPVRQTCLARRVGKRAMAPLEPLTVLETLTSHHTLMRSGDGIAFQHQQFQEWYASNQVSALMRASAQGDASARVQLRAGILDQSAWEESILFATERLSREPG